MVDYSIMQAFRRYTKELENKQINAKKSQVGGDHYVNMGVQPWDVIDTWPLEQQIGYYRGSALKYIMRMGTKDESGQEIRKARHYLDKLTEVLEELKKRKEDGDENN